MRLAVLLLATVLVLLALLLFPSPTLTLIVLVLLVLLLVLLVLVLTLLLLLLVLTLLLLLLGREHRVYRRPLVNEMPPFSLYIRAEELDRGAAALREREQLGVDAARPGDHEQKAAGGPQVVGLGLGVS